MLRRAALAALLLLSLASVAGAAGHGLPPRHEYPRVVLSVLNKYPRCFRSPWTSLVYPKDNFGGSRVMAMPAQGTSARNVYGNAVTRIGYDSGVAWSVTGHGSAGSTDWNLTTSGVWGDDNRHHYTKDSPWNADGTLYMIQNPGSTTDTTTGNNKANPNQSGPATVILSTSSWQPTAYFQCYASDSVRDLRWHPTNPYWMIVLKQTTSRAGSGNDTTFALRAGSSEAADYVAIIDVRTCQVVRKTNGWLINADLIGMGEGSVTAAGDKIMLATNHRPHNFTRPDTLQVIDLSTSPMTVGTPWPAPPCSLEVDASPSGGSDNQKMDCNIGHATLAPSGNRGWILYASDDAQDGSTAIDTTDAIRVFDVSGTTITGLHMFARDTLYNAGYGAAARSRSFCATSMIGGGNTLTGSTGWIANLKHADALISPVTGHDIIVGVQKCGNSGTEGKVAGVDINTGRWYRISSGAGLGGGESSPVHVSCRNQQGRLGYAFVSYDDANGTSPQAELVAYKADGSGSLVRLVESRTRDTGNGGATSDYRSESHLVPDWTGRHLAWASNWVYNCGGTCGTNGRPKDFVVDLTNLCSLP